VADIAIGAGLAATAVGVYLILTGQAPRCGKASSGWDVAHRAHVGTDQTGLLVNSTW